MAKRIKHQARIASWNQYINTLNVNTPMSKIWKRIAKIRGNHQNFKIPYIINNNNHITEIPEISEVMALHYETVSGNQNYYNSFKRIRRIEEAKPLKYRTHEETQYNKPFTILELYRAYKSCPNKAPGFDRITYTMIKQSHKSCQKLYLEIVNKIWKTECYPSQWKSSIILSFPKPNKQPTKEENYRPISLTSCVGKIMEKWSMPD